MSMSLMSLSNSNMTFLERIASYQLRRFLSKSRLCKKSSGLNTDWQAETGNFGRSACETMAMEGMNCEGDQNKCCLARQGKITTRCPAWSDQVKKWSESRAAAPKGRCPVGHRGEFPDVLRRHIKGLTCLILSLTRLI